ncbi:MAG TPA: prolipoprotein diacylglyceryl transferase [Patescibacteria group bacterium]|jgi:phosphatidylglycerol:prolipoprotein diacylglycerol transferase|nr:prolipoprotein diacylglyceryl transferase [Patescibacteria group bacterium]
MMPVLFEFNLFGWDIALPTYGFLLAVAFLLALAVALRQARRAGVDPNVVTDLWIISLISGVVGAKLLLYLLDINYYVSHPRAILTTLRSAGVFYGGLIVAIVVCLIVVKRRGLDAWLIGDVLAPAIILGQGVGRWGCFAAGCCYGKPASVAWAVTFTDPRASEVTGVPLNVPLHPSQLYLSLADFVLFFILLAVAARKKFQGQVALLYMILYAVLRGTLETFRGDPRGEFFGLSTSQWLSIALGIVGVVLYIWKSKRGAPTGAPGRAGDDKRRTRKEAPSL